MRHAMLLATLAAMVVTVPASADAPARGQVATTKQQAVKEIHDHVGVGTGIVATYATNIRCKPVKRLKGGRAKTWKCSFDYRDTRLSDSAPLACRATYRIGKQRDGTWWDQKTGSKVCRSAS